MISSLPVWIRKNRAIRKLMMLIGQVPRTIKRVSATKQDYLDTPPVLGNSFPKSGTHLLSQILEALPGVKDYGSFLASMPAISQMERSHDDHLRMIDKIAPGEILLSHLYYHPDYHAELVRKNCIHYFIYRDLRDVIISDILYLTNEYRIHRLHKFYSGHLKNMDERITASILGNQDSNSQYNFPDINQRFQKYYPWINCESVLSIKFDELVIGGKNDIVKQIAQFYCERSNSLIDVEELSKLLEANIDPIKSHTFRKGVVGEWKQYFSQEHKEQMKEVAGDLLIKLGFENDHNW